MGGDAGRIIRARVKKGSLVWISGSLELEVFTGKDGITTDKRLKVLLDNRGFVPVWSGRADNNAQNIEPPEVTVGSAAVIDGERDTLPE